MPKISDLAAGSTPTGVELLAAVQSGQTVKLTTQQVADAFLLTSRGANTFLAGPSAGGATQPTFRSLANADLPATVQALDNLDATAGIVVQTAADTFTKRSLAGTESEIDVSDGDGLGGNPTVSLPDSITLSGKTLTGGTFASPTLSGYVDLEEIATPGSPSANVARLYAADQSAITRLAYTDAGGTVHRLLTGPASGPSSTGANTFSQGSGERLEIIKHSSPLNYTGTPNAIVVQVEQTDDLGTLAFSPSVEFYFTTNADGDVNSGAELSQSFWQGLYVYQDKTGDGSAHAFTASGRINAVGPGGYNELGLFQADGTNNGSVLGTLSGCEILLRDSPDSGSTSYDTRMGAHIGRIARYNGGSRRVYNFFASSEGSADVDAVLGINEGGTKMWKQGLDFRNAVFSTGRSAIFPNNTNLAWEGAVSGIFPVLAMNSSDEVCVIAPSDTATTRFINQSLATVLEVGSVVSPTGLLRLEASASAFPLMTATGSATNVDIGIVPKGTGEVIAAKEDGGTNTVLYPVRLRRTSSGAPANGIGVGLKFEVETSAGNNEIGALLAAAATDVSSGSEDFGLDVYLMAGGAAANRMYRFLPTGLLRIGNQSTVGVDFGVNLQSAFLSSWQFNASASTGGIYFYDQTNNKFPVFVDLNSPTDAFHITATEVQSVNALSALKSTAIPAGGSAGAGLMFSSTANFGMFFGSGAPTLSAAKGSIYLRSDGSSTSTRVYVNTDGGASWTAITTAS